MNTLQSLETPLTITALTTFFWFLKYPDASPYITLALGFGAGSILSLSYLLIRGTPPCEEALSLSYDDFKSWILTRLKNGEIVSVWSTKDTAQNLIIFAQDSITNQVVTSIDTSRVQVGESPGQVSSQFLIDAENWRAAHYPIKFNKLDY